MIRMGPWLVIRGTLVGILFVVLASSMLTAKAAFSQSDNPPPAPDQSSEVTTAENPIVSPAVQPCQVSANFPHAILQWCETISAYADQFSLNPDLVAAVIYLESGGDPTAYSKSGAVGLMQVMPRDGLAEKFICINGPCFANRPSIAELENPSYNIHYGTRMLNQLLQRHGNLRDALKAYGPMDVGYSYADKVIGIYKRYRAE